MKRSPVFFMVAIAILVFWNLFGERFGHTIHREMMLPIGVAVLATSAWYLRDWWKSFEAKTD